MPLEDFKKCVELKPQLCQIIIAKTNIKSYERKTFLAQTFPHNNNYASCYAIPLTFETSQFFQKV